eukprot:CAMPEP_0170557354 /NCGR_PEP_ID=MMETSP0211-20121228/24329_1 /TAXON_ID=311385 /ORGANISM="Pseudokeronopsis sp., Strain OXSARD2" /LENGTH=86 /DNA_ID=CAMNT_0010868291 /DNA_START=115 /DNA_END=371 /DNA_ORIENTATION=-
MNCSPCKTSMMMSGPAMAFIFSKRAAMEASQTSTRPGASKAGGAPLKSATSISAKLVSSTPSMLRERKPRKATDTFSMIGSLRKAL